MNVLRDKETGVVLGDISNQQLQFLIDHLEEESANDTDYYINKATLAMFEGQGIDPQLLGLLQKAMGERDDIEIEWSVA